MADPIYGRAYWPLARSCVNCTYTVSHGIQPGVAVFTMPPQPDRPPTGVGILRITDGTGILRLPDCKLHSLSVVMTDKGPMWQLYILDRRWKWEFGFIDGCYNVHDDNGELIPRTVQSAAALGVLCLAAMGETDFDCSALPSDQFPTVDWNHANPAQSLQSLAEQFGCRVVYRPSSNTVLVANLGDGMDLPDLPSVRLSPQIDFPDTPDSLLFVGGPRRFEAYFILEAVGEDIDGQVKLINDLFYIPTINEGWTVAAPPVFANIPKLQLDPRSQELTPEAQYQKTLDLAAKSVYKWYRVSMSRVDGTVGNPIIPGYGEILFREQIILESTLLETAVRSDGTLIERPAEVSGIFARDKQQQYAASDMFGNSQNTEKIQTTFTVDANRCLIMFNDPIFQRTNSQIYPAAIVLRCAVQIRDPITNQVLRYERPFLEIGGGGNATGPATVFHPEIQFRCRGKYTQLMPQRTDLAPLYQLTGLDTNQVKADAAATVYLNIAAAKYQRIGVQDREYAGIIPIAPDGAIQQVTWTIGTDGPPKTRATRNGEHASWLPTYEQLRRISLMKPVVDSGFSRKIALAPGQTMKDLYKPKAE